MMNIQTVAQNLRVTIAGKEQHLKTLNGDLIAGDYVDRTVTKTTIEFLKINIDELKRILQDIEQCSPSLPGEGNNDSWITNPDRSGGQFTDEEINRAGEWR
jgi:hypothetical protein